jgi:chemotaxis signal transduction protein
MTAALVSSKAQELREAFDGARAAPVILDGGEKEIDLLGVRVGGDAYAIEVREIGALVKAGRIVALPSPLPELIGLAGVRGVAVPVYSLSALLGYSRESAEGCRWLALCGGEEPLALGFAEFEGHLRIREEAICKIEQRNSERSAVQRVAKTGNWTRAIVSVGLLEAAIEERCRKSGAKER